MTNKINERLGKLKMNNFHNYMEVVEYIDANNIVVEFLEYKSRVKTTWQLFNKGEVRCPFDITVDSRGYFGEGVYKSINKDKTPTLAYRKWMAMMKRTNPKNPIKNYENVRVCEDWFNFQNFAKWFDENYVNCETEEFELDKDLFSNNDKIYSPETCCFLPSCINSFLSTINYSHKSKFYYNDKKLKLKILADKYKNSLKAEVYTKLIKFIK